MSGPKAILFVCLHNACRSRIAETIARDKAPGSWIIDSAGAEPSEGVDPKAVEILRRSGLVMRKGKPQRLDDFMFPEWDCVVDISCARVCARVPARKRVEWDIPDPHDGPMERYERLFSELERRVTSLIQGLL